MPRQSQACQILECWGTGEGRGMNRGLAKLKLESTALPHIWGVDGLWVPYNEVCERVWGSRGFPVGQRQGRRVPWGLPDLSSCCPVDSRCSFTRLWSQPQAPGARVQDRASTLFVLQAWSSGLALPLDTVSIARGHVRLPGPFDNANISSQKKNEH